MGTLRINKVAYQGDRYWFESPILDKNLVLVEGDNGTGKTTFCNLIYFCLGGRVKEFLKDGDRQHKEITSDTNNFVELYITVSGKNFQLRRFLGDNDITVTPYAAVLDKESGKTSFSTSQFAESTKVLPINRSAEVKYIFSDWMLERLGISVVELYQGYTTFKINFSDLCRLLYHDQQPNPEYVYKRTDVKSNHIADSELLRKAIFELLIGKSFSDYYDSIVEAKKTEKAKLLSKALLDEYARIVDHLRGREEVRNVDFLKSELQEKYAQVERLQAARNAFKRNRAVDASLQPAIENIKAEIVSLEIDRSVSNDKLLALYDEKSKLATIKETTAQEIGQIGKVIHSHDQLNLFSADTCPYCLTHVDRVAGHCVCGSEIDEEQYERFFYTSQEYKEILKAKTKTLATVDLAIAGCDEELREVKTRIESGLGRIQALRESLRSKVGNLDSEIDIDSLNDIDDKILETREQIGVLAQRIDGEAKLMQLTADYEAKRQLHQTAELNMRSLEAKTKIEITEKVNRFSAKYGKRLTETLSDCRSARISVENYLPVVNEGEYREASSGVSIRLMYFLTLLDMSLSEKDVPFPKFLLIDTPETAGIELDNLLACMNKFSDMEEFKTDYQIILTTGLNKYPPHFKLNRAMFLPSKKEALLQAR